MTDLPSTIAGILRGTLRYRDVKHIDCAAISDPRHQDILAVALSCMAEGRKPTTKVIEAVCRRMAATDGYDAEPVVAELHRIAEGCQ